MKMDHIFESGHPISTIFGWVLFIITSGWFAVLLPCVYDAWIVNRKINLAIVDERQLERRQAAIERLARYYDFVVRHTNYRNRSGILNDFGKHAVWLCFASAILVIASIFSPFIFKIMGWLIIISM